MSASQSLSLAGAGSQCCSSQLHEHARTPEWAVTVSACDPAASTSDDTSCVHCCWDATYSAPNADWNDSSSAGSTRSAIDTGLIFRTNTHTDAGFCSKRDADTKHTYRADCGTGSSHTTTSDPSSTPVCANPAAISATTNICAGAATRHSSKYQLVAFFLCSGIPQAFSLHIAPCRECIEPIVVDSSFYLRPKGSVCRCVKVCVCVFRCSQHCLKEGGVLNDFELLKVKMAAVCRKMRHNRPNVIFGLNQNRSSLIMKFA